MKTILKVVLSALLLVLANKLAFAQDRGGNVSEAIALVKKAVDYVKTHGREKAFAEFKNPSGPFRDRALFLVVYDIKGTKLAHGVNQKMIGKNNLELKDIDGKYIVKDFIDIATGKGKGWVDYKWPNPMTGAIEPKSTYIERFEDIIIGCGIYPGFFSVGKVHPD
ncbi:MAG: cache domain-containing protein [Pseudomonadota bacterium]